MKILLVYKTKTGFTKRYVDWIAEEIPCKKINLQKIDTIEIDNYDIIIYGAGMHATKINGLKKFKKKVRNLSKQRIIVFATGASPCTKKIVDIIKENNFTDKEKIDISFYYFNSGLNYEKMGFLDKTIMKTYSKILQLKRKKSKLEQGTNSAILTSYDYSKKEQIKPLTSYLRKIIAKRSKKL